MTREGPAEATDAAMHALSLASGVAIARLVTPPDAALVEEAAVFVELVRRSLAVDAATLTAAMIVAQPLIQAFPDDWKLKYLIGLSLGLKLTTDGFHIRDIVEHLDSVRAERLELFGEGGGEGGKRPKPLARAVRRAIPSSSFETASCAPPRGSTASTSPSASRASGTHWSTWPLSTRKCLRPSRMRRRSQFRTQTPPIFMF